jgi:hypothetical protein
MIVPGSCRLSGRVAATQPSSHVFASQATLPVLQSQPFNFIRIFVSLRLLSISAILQSRPFSFIEIFVSLRLLSISAILQSQPFNPSWSFS